MSKHKIVLGSIVCLLAASLVSGTFSQAQVRPGTRGGYRRPPRPPGSSPTHRSTKRDQTDETREASLKGPIGATDERWPAIKPKLERVIQLRLTDSIGIMTEGAVSVSGGSRPPGYSAKPGSSAGGRASLNPKAGDGWSKVTKTGPDSSMRWRWMPSWGDKGPQTEEEKLSDALLRLLQHKDADPGEIRRIMDALRKVKEQRERDLAAARKELRDVLTLDQQARAVALGWLD